MKLANLMGLMALALLTACGGGEGTPNYTDLCLAVQIQGEGAPSCVPLIDDGNESEGEEGVALPAGLQVRVHRAETNEGERVSNAFDVTRAIGEEGTVHFSTELEPPDALKATTYKVELVGTLSDGWSVFSGNGETVDVLVNEMTTHAIVIAPAPCDGAVMDCDGDSVVDALEPGGSGNPLADVNVHVQANADGAPLAGVRVVVEEYDPAGNWRTDKDGNVLVQAPVSYEEVHVSVALDGFVPQQAVVVLDMNRPAPVTFRLRPPAPAGRVEWLAGERLATVAVCECRDLPPVMLNGVAAEAACTSEDPDVVAVAGDCSWYCGESEGETSVSVAVGAISGPSYAVSVTPNALGETVCTE